MKESIVAQTNGYIRLNMRKRRKTAHRRILVAVVVFAMLFVGSVAYAASTGALFIRGSIARDVNLSVKMQDAYIIGGARVGETLTVSVANNYQVMDINVRLMNPGDVRTIIFHVLNDGNQAARVMYIEYDHPDETTSGLLVEYPDDIPESPNLNGTVFMPGSYSEDYMIVVRWDANATTVPTGITYPFRLIMHYQNAACLLADGTNICDQTGTGQ